MKGWLFVDTKSKNWTQQIYKHRSVFQNPLHQNYKHVMTIKNILNVNDDIMHSAIVFVGSAVFKTTKPENIYNISQLKKLLKQESMERLSAEQICNYSQEIITTKLDNTFANNRNHVKHLKEKYESINTCPKCNSPLIERVVKSGDNKGNTFFGCSSFPKCKYIKKLNHYIYFIVELCVGNFYRNTSMVFKVI